MPEFTPGKGVPEPERFGYGYEYGSWYASKGRGVYTGTRPGIQVVQAPVQVGPTDKYGPAGPRVQQSGVGWQTVDVLVFGSSHRMLQELNNIQLGVADMIFDSTSLSWQRRMLVICWKGCVAGRPRMLEALFCSMVPTIRNPRPNCFNLHWRCYIVDVNMAWGGSTWVQNTCQGHIKPTIYTYFFMSIPTPILICTHMYIMCIDSASIYRSLYVNTHTSTHLYI